VLCVLSWNRNVRMRICAFATQKKNVFGTKKALKLMKDTIRVLNTDNDVQITKWHSILKLVSFGVPPIPFPVPRALRRSPFDGRPPRHVPS